MKNLQPVTEGKYLNPELIIWNLVSFSGGTANDRVKFGRILKKDGYSNGMVKGQYMRHNPTLEVANTHLHQLKGLKVVTIQITDTQFGQIKITY